MFKYYQKPEFSHLTSETRQTVDSSIAVHARDVVFLSIGHWSEIGRYIWTILQKSRICTLF